MSGRAEARAGSLATRAECIDQLSSCYRGTGDNKKAMQNADELRALGVAAVYTPGAPVDEMVSFLEGRVAA